MEDSSSSLSTCNVVDDIPPPPLPMALNAGECGLLVGELLPLLLPLPLLLYLEGDEGCIMGETLPGEEGDIGGL